jgi:ribosomal protein S18 acetylase RimI-like enzyme
MTGKDNFTYRQEVLKNDCREVRQITEGTGFFHDYEVDIAVELFQERFDKKEKSGYYFTIAQNQAGSLVGFAIYGPIACTKGSFDFYWIVVDKVSQGQGLGRYLADLAETEMLNMGARAVYIETSSQELYLPTRYFYEKRNYILEARLKDFYAPGDDKLIYTKVLGA